MSKTYGPLMDGIELRTTPLIIGHLNFDLEVGMLSH
jgi:hypothetical protein